MLNCSYNQIITFGQTVYCCFLLLFLLFIVPFVKYLLWFSYAKAYDPDNWFTIDEETAEIKLNKVPDRESLFLVNGTYIAKILAMTKGKTISTSQSSKFIINNNTSFLPSW